MEFKKLIPLHGAVALLPCTHIIYTSLTKNTEICFNTFTNITCLLYAW